MKLSVLFPYEFKDQSLLKTACSIHLPAGQRLEWLGDRVLNQCVALLLYRNHPQRNEAELSRALAKLVNNERLQGFGMLLDMPELHGPRKSHKALGDVIEAVYGAVLLDGGFAAALACTRYMYGDLLEHPATSFWLRDAKTLLKETCERERKPLPDYHATPTECGYLVTCRALDIAGHGKGQTKFEAEMNAALEIVTTLALVEVAVSS